MHLDYPYHVDGRGRTATTSEAEHVRDLVEQVLFTQPGERVNRPDFGSGLLQLTFAPLSDELASATQFLVQGALEQWLGRVIALEQVTVTRDDAVLRVLVSYTLRHTGERRSESFERPVPGI
jgi:phage baseplate assembly protein W